MPTKEYIEKWRISRTSQGLCFVCGLRPQASPGTKYGKCQECLVKNRPKTNSLTKEYYVKCRHLALEHYGAKCICCGETEEKFLHLDHKDNDGKEHRIQIKGVLSQWLVTNNFPTDYEIQILCANCHNAKSFYGSCPHQS
jgi:hypothetical protein